MSSNELSNMNTICHEFPTFLVKFILLTRLINSPVIPDPVILT